MKLKKIVISGFKSFADRVNLNFDDGITGIVGPNGSGKSNVIDAVRWVMGEQSAKHLRGQVATDIIFAGSDKRKALGMAEVTLIFDNSDFSELCPPEYRNEPEIAIGRRLYSDGQRDYFINRKPCRLKDIVGFFTLTGLGGRSYSMIQQGQVDRILNAKPEDVRLILEEASGTLAYKSRRDACRKKLERTQENLSRIEDIISELARQLKALEGQVETAKKAKEWTEDLKEGEVKLFYHNFKFFQSQLVKLEEEASLSTEKEAQFISDIADIEAHLAKLQTELAEADPELDQLRESLATAREAIARAESKMTQAFESIAQSEQRLLDLETEVETEHDNLGALKEMIETEEREISLAKTEEENLKEELAVLKDELERQDESAMVFRNREDQLNDDVKNLEMLLESNALRSEAIDRDRKKAATEIESFKERLSAIEADLKEQEPLLKKSEEEVAQSQTGLEEEVSQKDALDSEMASTFETIESHRKNLNAARESYIGFKTKKESLEELLSSTGDVGEALEKLAATDPKVKELAIGKLTDFISLDSENPLPTPLARAFDGWAERLLVEDAQHLDPLMELLHADGDMPQVAISLLETNSKEDIDSWASTCGATPLSSYLKVLKPHPLMDSFLSRLYMVAQSSLTPKLIQSVPNGVTLFWDKGVVVQSSYDFLFESPNSKGTLAKKAEISALADSMNDSYELVEGYEEEISVLEEKRQQLKEQLLSLEESLKEKNAYILEHVREFQSSKQDFEHKQHQKKEAQRQLEHHESSYEIFHKELENLGEARISLGNQREQLVQDAEGFKDESLDVLEMVEEVRRQHEAKRFELTEVTAKVAAKEQAFLVHQKQLDMMQSSFARREEEEGKIKKELAQAKQAETDCAEEMKELIKERESLDKVISEKRSANSELYNNIKSKEEAAKKARNQLASLQKQGSGSALERERLKISIESTMEQAQEKYQLDLETFEPDFKIDPDFSSQAATKAIQSLRQKIDRLGNINMMAIEEYEKLAKRNDFILAQKEDVESSISLLEEAIDEIEGSAKEKFLGIFKEINSNFAQLFPILFPGGDATLHLTNEEDPLNGGVDILVRLPGKKMRSMTLFSGGEKALTAIALIFALLKTKPTPFCFLDEVDAPLDEANVGRYNKVLEFLAERFQFVVITHNRRTMEVLDQLYGVTMMEGGVSRVVGVDMSRDIPNHLKKAFKDEKKGAAKG